MTATGSIRQLAVPVYFPWTLSGLGIGMLIPVLPLYLRQSGLSFTMVAVVLAASGVGAALAGLPTATVLSKVGERRLVAIGVTAMAVTTVALGLTEAVVALVVFRFIFGGGSISVRLALQTVITRSVPVHRRGRAMSAMGGTARLAFLVGPLLGGALLDATGFRVVFAITGVIMLSGLALQLSGPSTGVDNADQQLTGDEAPMRQVLVRHRSLLLRAGAGSALVMTVRTGRQVVVPLIGHQLGMSATVVGALVAIGAAADLALFPVAGYVMDAFGRLWAIVPSFMLLAVGLFMLAAADTTSAVVVASVVMGIGNGLSSGTLLTVASDLAPLQTPGPFLAAMAVMQDSGKIAGPLLVGWFADAAGLQASAAVLGVAMVTAIAWIVGAVGETRDYAAGP